MDFLAAVNRVLRTEGIIRGDDDAVAAFTDTQHAATIELAQIAIQDEMNDLIAQEVIPYEMDVATITTIAATRVYTLEPDFVRMRVSEFVREDGSGNAQSATLFPFLGGEQHIARTVPMYREQAGTPSWYYFTGGATKSIGLYPVPDAVAVYRYYYEKSVSVMLATDPLPFVAEAEAQAFVRAAARRFRYLFVPNSTRDQLFPNGVGADPVVESARATLMALLSSRAAVEHYGRHYG